MNETNCKITSVIAKQLYTHIVVDVGEKTTVDLDDNKIQIESNETAIYPTPGANIWLLLKKY